jgi:glycosyltransferase involved in cell wall biosynthesis
MKIALIRGPYLRHNGILPWEYINNRFKDVKITAFESIPTRFNNSTLDMPLKKLHWLDGKIKINDRYIIKDGLNYLNLPNTILLGINKIVKEYDIIHTSENFNFFSFQVALLCKIQNKKFAFSSGENIPFKPNQYITWKIKKFVNTTANGITTTTPLGKRALIHEGVNPNKISIISNVIDLKYFKRQDKEPEKIKLPSELKITFNILFVHGLKEQKGIYYLLKAFKNLIQKYKDIRLILVGKNHLEKHFYYKHITKNQYIYHLNFVPNNKIQDVYNLCDIFILPSITMQNNEEQFGMSILEAMACNKPSIVTDIGGLSYIAKNSKTSLIIKERSVKEIIKAIEKLYKNEDIRKELGDYSYRYVRSNFSKHIVGYKLYKFYKNIYSC